MSFKWSGIVNTLQHAVAFVKKEGELVLDFCVKVEPFAASALKLAGQPEAAAILSTVYNIVENTETSLANQPGITKLAVAQTAISSAAIPLLSLGLAQSGRKLDVDAANAAATDAINAVVAENNAQAALQKLLADSTASGKVPDAAELVAATDAVSLATSNVLKAGTEIQAAIKSVIPSPSK